MTKHEDILFKQLIKAVCDSDLDEVKRLVRLGVPLNKTDELDCTALMYAIGDGNLNIIDYLITQGADIKR